MFNFAKKDKNLKFKKVLLKELAIMNYTIPELKGEFQRLDEFPAIGIRVFSSEPMLDGSSNIFEQFNYFVKLPDSPKYNGDRSYLVSYESEICVVRTYMLRSPNSFFSSFKSKIHDEYIDILKRDIGGVKSKVLSNSQNSFVYYLSDDALLKVNKLIK